MNLRQILFKLLFLLEQAKTQIRLSRSDRTSLRATRQTAEFIGELDIIIRTRYALEPYKTLTLNALIQLGKIFGA